MHTKGCFWLVSFFSIFFAACHSGGPNGQLPPPGFPVFVPWPADSTGLDLTAGSAGTGLAVADFNLDGLPDLYFASTTGSNQLFFNQGNLRFADVTAAAGVALPFGVKTGVALADVNGDGWPDLFQCRSGANPADRGNQLFVNQRNGAFLQQAGAYRLNVSFASAGAVFFDSDLDGDLDLLLVNRPGDFAEGTEPTGGTDRFFRNDANHFTLVGDHAGISNRGPVSSVNVLDLNRDRFPDLLATTAGPGPGQLWLNLGNGTFADNWGQLPVGKEMAAVADLDSDYLPDLCMVGQDGENGIWRGQTLHTQPSRTPVLAGIRSTSHSLQPLIGDLDNDGRPDFFLANYREGADVRNFIFQNRDTLQLTEVTSDWGLVAGMAPQVAVLADLDADGDLDLVMRTANGEAMVFKNQTVEFGRGNFVQVRLQGPVGNTAGIGAEVRVLAGGLAQAQVQRSHCGLGCAVLLPLHFGLGSAAQLERLEVQWPNGRRQVLENVKAGSLLTLNHADAQAGG